MDVGGPTTGPVRWTEPVELAPLRVGAGLPPAPALRTMGAVLARLHAITPLGMRVAPRPWVLDTRRPGNGSTGRAAVDVLDRLLADPPVAAAVARAATMWEPAAVVHGDATIDNALGEPASDTTWTVRLVGFDHAGLGMPVWDVVTAVDSIEVAGLLGGTDAALAVAELLAGYQPDRRVWASWRPYRVARAVQSAVELAARSVARGPGSDVAELVARATGLAVDPA